MHEQLLQAVIEFPNKDEPRLAYAKFLDQRNDPRGEFIRLQIEIEKHHFWAPQCLNAWEAAQRLFDQFGQEWGPVDPPWVGHTAMYFENRGTSVGYRVVDRLRRGFPFFCWTTLDELEAAADCDFDHAPYTHAKIEGLCGSGAKLRNSRNLSRFQSLILYFKQDPPRPKSFVDSWDCENLRELMVKYSPSRTPDGYMNMDAFPVLDDDDMEVIAQSGMRKLERLEASTNYVTSKGLKHLANSNNLANLCQLDLGNNQIDDVGLVYLADSPLASQIESLEFQHNPIGNRGLEALGAAGLPKLRRLELRGKNGVSFDEKGLRAILSGTNRLEELSLWQHKLSLETVSAISEMEELRNLKKLDLSSSNLDSEMLRCLANSRSLESLHFLNIQNNPSVDPLAFAELVCSPIMSNITCVEYVGVDGNMRGDEKLTAFTRSQYLGQLRFLSLTRIGTSRAAGIEFLKSAYLPKLRSLCLDFIPIGNDGAKLILESASFHNLEFLSIRDCGIGQDMQRALVKRFGEKVDV